MPGFFFNEQQWDSYRKFIRQDGEIRSHADNTTTEKARTVAGWGWGSKWMWEVGRLAVRSAVGPEVRHVPES